MSDSSMVAFKRRMHEERRWDEFVTYRNKLLNGGVKPAFAGRIASFEFLPRDGSPHEVLAPPGSTLGRMIQSTQALFPTGPPAEPVYVEAQSHFHDFKVVNENNAKFVSNSRQISEEWEAWWCKIMLEVPNDRTANQMESFRWIYQNAGTPPSMIEAGDVPSRGTLRHLRHVQSSDKAYQEFLDSFALRAMPDRKAMEHESRYEDDGRSILKLLDDHDLDFNTEEQEVESA